MPNLSFWLAPPVLAARMALGMVFLNAVWPKWRNPRSFADVLAQYRLLPDGLVLPGAAGIVLAETGVGLGLLVAVERPNLVAMPAGLGALVLLGLFVIAMALNLGRGRGDIACGCGTGATPLSWHGVALTGSLAFLAFLAAAPTGTPSAWIQAQAILAGLLLLALYEAASQVISLRLKIRQIGKDRS